MPANGTVIEQAQILTTHNLTALVHAVSVAPTVGWPETARRTFATVLQLAGRIERNPRLLRLIKDTAYAWRHLVFFPRRFHTLATGGVHVDLTDAAPAVRVKIEPALVGLGYIAASGRFADERTPAGGHRLLASSPLTQVCPQLPLLQKLAWPFLQRLCGIRQVPAVHPQAPHESTEKPSYHRRSFLNELHRGGRGQLLILRPAVGHAYFPPCDTAVVRTHVLEVVQQYPNRPLPLVAAREFGQAPGHHHQAVCQPEDEDWEGNCLRFFRHTRGEHARASAELAVLRTEVAALAPWATEEGQVANEGSHFHQYFSALNRFLAARSRRLFTVSAASAADIVSMLDVAPDRVMVVPAGVDPNVFRRPGPPAARAEATAPGPYLLFAGLTHAHKRLDWILQRLVPARSSFQPGTRLLVTGGHAERDGAVRAGLPEDAADFVKFLGRVEDHELAALYRGAAALLSASLSEGSNLSAQEAMACGCPVIATGIPAHRETLGRDANLFAPDDGDAFLRLVRQALSGTLPRTVRNGAGWERSARRLIDGLEAALT